jgi:hypothetical protein
MRPTYTLLWGAITAGAAAAILAGAPVLALQVPVPPPSNGSLGQLLSGSGGLQVQTPLDGVISQLTDQPPAQATAPTTPTPSTQADLGASASGDASGVTGQVTAPVSGLLASTLQGLLP